MSVLNVTRASTATTAAKPKALARLSFRYRVIMMILLVIWLRWLTTGMKLGQGTPPESVLGQLQQRLPVSRSFLWSESMQDLGIAEDLPVLPKAPQRQPRHRVEPMDRTGHRDQPVQQNVVRFEVRQLVKKDQPNLPRAETLKKSMRKQELGGGTYRRARAFQVPAARTW
jgi:hypothetical protein